MEIRDIRAVLFDMDGTLVDSDAVVDRSWSRWATEFGLVPAEVLAVAHGNPAMATVAHFLPDASTADRTAAWSRVFDLEVNEQPFAKGVSNQLVTVPRFGSAVISADTMSTLGGVLRQFGRLAQGERPSFAYRIRGNLSISGSNVPFDRRGDFDPTAFLSK